MPHRVSQSPTATTNARCDRWSHTSFGRTIPRVPYRPVQSNGHPSAGGWKRHQAIALKIRVAHDLTQLRAALCLEKVDALIPGDPSVLQPPRNPPDRLWATETSIDAGP